MRLQYKKNKRIYWLFIRYICNPMSTITKKYLKMHWCTKKRLSLYLQIN